MLLISRYNIFFSGLAAKRPYKFIFVLSRITVICYKYKDGHGQMLKQLKENYMIRKQILSRIKKKRTDKLHNSITITV